MTGFIDISAPHWEPAWVVVSNLGRVGLAAVLGGCLGMERELKRRAAGLRTNMLICFGSALFTVLSGTIAAQIGGDHTRIAAQIIPGIGFIGAGCILHARASVQGLTTAATIFVVAAIGMASGGGFYLTAIFATMVALLVLLALEGVEERFQLKSLPMTYEVHGPDPGTLISEINGVLEEMQRPMESVQLGRDDGHYRMQFVVNMSAKQRSELIARLRMLGSVTRVNSFQSPERE